MRLSSALCTGIDEDCAIDGVAETREAAIIAEETINAAFIGGKLRSFISKKIDALQIVLVPGHCGSPRFHEPFRRLEGLLPAALNAI